MPAFAKAKEFKFSAVLPKAALLAAYARQGLIKTLIYNKIKVPQWYEVQVIRRGGNDAAMERICSGNKLYPWQRTKTSFFILNSFIQFKTDTLWPGSIPGFPFATVYH